MFRFGHGFRTKRRAAAGVLAVLGLTATAVFAGAGPAAAAYGDCPEGKACLFKDSDGNGEVKVLDYCGINSLPMGWRMQASSVRTHGNAVTLIGTEGHQVGFVDRWTQTNLSLAENDQALHAVVHCP